MAIPSIFNVILITGLIFLIFGIIGVNFFKGLYYYCETSQISNLPSYQLAPMETKWDCINIGGEWLPDDYNFDDIFSAIEVVFNISQTFSWGLVMYAGMASNGVDMVPKQYNSPYYFIYFVLFIIVGNFFITNLFVGVVISTYNREKEKLGKLFLLTKDQKKWLEMKLLVIQAKPKLYLKQPQMKCRIPFYKVARSKWFDRFIIVCIILNTIILMLSW